MIDRGGTGLRAWMVVRNVIEGLGVEFMYDLYSPTLKDIEVLKLEKRIDDELYYLRDCDPKHSTIPMDFPPEVLAENQAVPVNDSVLPLKNRPWSKPWQKFDDRLFGYTYQPEQLGRNREKKLDRIRSELAEVS